MKDIDQRVLRAVIKMVQVRKWRPKVLYLNHEDHAQFIAGRRTYLERNYIDGIEVRIGKKSRLYADHGYSGVSV